jgi:hypothetical protein
MLSNITLRWMIRQIIDCKIGVLFDYSSVELYRSRGILEVPPTVPAKGKWDWVNRVEESIKLDRDDVKHGIYDSIGWSALWNPLEYMPVAKPMKTDVTFDPTTTRWSVIPIYIWSFSKANWALVCRPNAKSGRSIYRTKSTDPIFIHSSVVAYLTSQDAEAIKESYKPRAKWYGYDQDDWPRIEDVPHIKDAAGVEDVQASSALPDDAKKKLELVRPPKAGAASKGWGFGLF